MMNFETAAIAAIALCVAMILGIIWMDTNAQNQCIAHSDGSPFAIMVCKHY